MGRPLKQGIDYFPLDVDFFSNIKIRKIAKACGPNASAVIVCLLCNIYRDEGYYILWDEDLPFVIADQVGVSEGCVKEIITKALQVDFFSKELYNKYQILTSAGIQKRFLTITYKRKEIDIDKKYMVSDVKKGVSDRKNSVKDIHNQQSKEKVKNKENTPKGVSKKDAAKAATLSRKESFYNSLIPFVGRYPKEMIRAFFDYWSELNKSGSKMRFEMQKTWELPLRLATWANHEKVTPRSEVGRVLTDNSTKEFKQEW